jgi:hypothetical protein
MAGMAEMSEQQHESSKGHAQTGKGLQEQVFGEAVWPLEKQGTDMAAAVCTASK